MGHLCVSTGCTDTGFRADPSCQRLEVILVIWESLFLCSETDFHWSLVPLDVLPGKDEQVLSLPLISRVCSTLAQDIFLPST